jgi:hypothetical protein
MKKMYVSVVGIPDDPWDVDANWEDAYYRAANLQYLWDTAMKAIEGKIPKDGLDAFDVEFAKNMILEFHKVDEKGVRFRYHGERFGVRQNGHEGASPEPPLHRIKTSDTISATFSWRPFVNH